MQKGVNVSVGQSARGSGPGRTRLIPLLAGVGGVSHVAGVGCGVGATLAQEQRGVGCGMGSTRKSPTEPKGDERPLVGTRKERGCSEGRL